MTQVRTMLISVSAVLGLLIVPLNWLQARTLSVSASTREPAPVGTVVTWNASVDDGSSGNLWYRFRIRYTGTVPAVCTAARVSVHSRCLSNDFVMVRDFGPDNSLDWTASEHEGDYEIEVSSRDNGTGEVTVTTTPFHVTPRVRGRTPMISATSLPLVFEYSAPPCPAGSRMHVQFRSTDGLVQSTSPKLCDGAMTMNFYLAGMRPETQYTIQHIVDDGTQTTTGPVMTQTTGTIDQTFGPYSVLQPPADTSTAPILLQSRGGWPVATDLAGNIVWYFPAAISFMARPETGGYFLGWFEDQTQDTSHQYLREFDLAGNTIRETNAARVSEQLAAMGMHPINAFHHELRPLANEQILALAASERILTDVQGRGAVDVLGDTILVLDQNLQVTWAWDAFDHLDTSRKATLGETCNQSANGCSPIYLAPVANDWTHGNSVQLMPDGNILFSSRHQDWLIKIDYQNGQGAGAILWRLGKDGDFQFLSGDPYPWFSHQHDATVDADGLLTLFDNGNVRNAADPSAHSRGQAFRLDERNFTATPVLNADLGEFSIALGSAQQLANGDYHFHLGFLPATNTARVVEVDPTGAIVYKLDIGELEYRSFRRSDLYTQ